MQMKLRTKITRIGRDTALLFGALIVANASNYIFHIVVSRDLGPSDYGALGSILALLVVLSVPFSAVQTTVAKRMAQADQTSTTELWRGLVRGTIAPAVVGALLVGVVITLLSKPLGLGSPLVSALVGLYMIPAVLLPVLRGVFQGGERYGALALVSVAPVVLRLGAGALLGGAGGVEAIVSISVLAEIFGITLSLLLLKTTWKTVLTTRPVAYLKEAWPIGVALAAVWVLAQIDLVMAHKLLGNPEAGAYVAAGQLARSILFLSSAIGIIAFPLFSKKKDNPQEAYRLLSALMVPTLAIGIAAGVGLAAFRSPILGLTFGGAYEQATQYLPFAAAAVVPLGLINLTILFQVATGGRSAFVWLGVGVELFLLLLVARSPLSSSIVFMVVAWFTAIGSLVRTRRSVLTPDQHPSDLPPWLVVTPGDPVMERPATVQLSVVVPCYNGGAPVSATVRSILGVLHSMAVTHEVIIVSDGSTDGSNDDVAQIQGPVTIVHYADRRGKGVALRIGLDRSIGDYVAFIDADGELDPAEFKRFLAVMKLYEPDLVVGSKRHPLSNVEYPLLRRLMSSTYQLLTRLVFRLKIRDTQTGMKLMKRNVVQSVLPYVYERRFAFDLEFVVVARHLGFDQAFEVPISLAYKFDSTVSLRSVMNTIKDTIAIAVRLYIHRSYEAERPRGPITTRVIDPVAVMRYEAAGS